MFLDIGEKRDARKKCGYIQGVYSNRSITKF